MEYTLGTRLKNAWSAFLNRDPTNQLTRGETYGASYYRRPDRVRFTGSNEKTLSTAIYNRIAIDAAAIDISHVRLDENERYAETIYDGLNDCLNLEANLDQSGFSFKQDMYMSLLDEGYIAIVPVSANRDPRLYDSFEVFELRTGKIVEWRPYVVKIRLYNDHTGQFEEQYWPKKSVAIIENPFYSVMNETNSVMRRLIRKMAIMDEIDEQVGAGKLDMIIQLPYAIKTESRREQAEKRRKDIETQLKDGKYGIAYTDGTEKIVQLNRPLENNLMKQIEYLTSMLYSQLGLTQEIMNGTADDKAMLNYNTRTIGVLVNTVVSELKRKFLSKTARSQKQSIMAFRDPFKLVPVNDIAELGDKFTRNEIMTSNEIRQAIGLKPSSDPKADELVNSNISQPAGMMDPNGMNPEGMEPEGGGEGDDFLNTPISELE